MERRDAVFQKLKPRCVALSQTALASGGSRGDLLDLTARLEDLHRTLVSSARRPHSLNGKLADYCFFPLSQVLKASKRLPIRCLELSLHCIAILVEHGWQSSMQPQLAAQIVILCTMLAERRPKGLSFTESTDELQATAFKCLYHLFCVAGESREIRQTLASEASFPQLGQCVTIVLNGIQDSGSAELQIAATSALTALVEHVADRELCASFMPGIVSRASRVLTPSTAQRRNHKVLIGCLGVVGLLIKATISDADTSLSMTGSNASITIIDKKWKQNAATQLKPALTSIVRLKDHSRIDVKAAFAELCFMILGKCRICLADCAALMLETLVIMSSDQTVTEITKSSIDILLRIDPSLSTILQDILYTWLQSLSTVMQSADEQAKKGKLQQINIAYGLLVDVGANTKTIDKIITGTLRDSVVITLQEPKIAHKLTTFVSPVQSWDLAVLKEAEVSTNFGSPLVQYEGQRKLMDQIELLVQRISGSSPSEGFTTDLARSLRTSHCEMQVADFWMLLTAVQKSFHRTDLADDFMIIDDQDVASERDILEELYAFSLSILEESSSHEAPDPRLQALALRTLALRAQRAGPHFRYELLDALYPVLHTLATPNKRLQEDSITTLNIFTAACDYGGIRDLIVENVDYLTNAIALKLNAFDVSPQAPQVLLMMVRLAGPSLLPYLEDTMESIFAVLEDYHGYGLLVELLFKVLGVIAEEGVKAPQLALKAGKAKVVVESLAEHWVPANIDQLALLLEEKRQDEALRAQTDREAREEHPDRPWTSAQDHDDDEVTEDEKEPPSTDQDQQMDVDNVLPPAPKTFNLLFKITELTQHFLPSASPSLRASLLGLVRTTIPAIARHENTFLPLINTLWPEIVSRLDDAEPHVQAATLEIIGLLCMYAGDFMRTRIMQLWPAILELHASIVMDIMASARPSMSQTATQQPKQSSTALMATTNNFSLKQAVMRMQSSPADYSDTTSRLMWSALVSMLTATVQHVQPSPEMFDHMLDMLEPVLEQQRVREVLLRQNADAVWLAGLRSGTTAWPLMPTVPDGLQWRFAEVLG